MRILAIHPAPAFSVADVHQGWVEAFRELGHTVGDFNLDDRLRSYGMAHMQRIQDDAWIKMFDTNQAIWLAAQGILAECFKFNPDVLFVTSGFFVPNEIMGLCRRKAIKVVLLHTESPYEDERQVRRALYADVNIVNDPTNLRDFPDGSYYQPHSYRPAIHHKRPARPEYASDVCFVGTGYASRIAFLEAVDWFDVDLCLAGNWQQLSDDSPLVKHLAHEKDQCLDNTDAHDLYASTKIGLNLYRTEGVGGAYDGWSIGPREVEMAAAEVFFLRQPRPEGDELFGMLPTFSSPKELGDLVRHWLTRPQEREDAAAEARLAISGRCFTAAATRLLDTIGGTDVRDRPVRVGTNRERAGAGHR